MIRTAGGKHGVGRETCGPVFHTRCLSGWMPDIVGAHAVASETKPCAGSEQVSLCSIPREPPSLDMSIVIWLSFPVSIQHLRSGSCEHSQEQRSRKGLRQRSSQIVPLCTEPMLTPSSQCSAHSFPEPATAMQHCNLFHGTPSPPLEADHLPEQHLPRREPESENPTLQRKCGPESHRTFPGGWWDSELLPCKSGHTASQNHPPDSSPSTLPPRRP